MFIQALESSFEWFSQFRIEDRFGFNNSTLKLWISDKIKESLLGLIIGSLLFALLIWLYRILSDWSDYWWLVAFGFLCSATFAYGYLAKIHTSAI